MHPRIREDVAPLLHDNECSDKSYGVGRVVGEYTSSNGSDEIVTLKDFEIFIRETVSPTGKFETEQSPSESGSDDEDISIDENLRLQLIQWVTQFGIHLVAVTGLLKLLQPLHPDIPTDA